MPDEPRAYITDDGTRILEWPIEEGAFVYTSRTLDGAYEVVALIGDKSTRFVRTMKPELAKFEAMRAISIMRKAIEERTMAEAG